MEYFLQQVITGIVMGGIYALVALGFVLIYKSGQRTASSFGRSLTAHAILFERG